MHRPMSSGQHILIFLYPLSRLGFTSPVGGSLGQVALESSGKNVSNSGQKPPPQLAYKTNRLRRQLYPPIPGASASFN